MNYPGRCGIIIANIKGSSCVGAILQFISNVLHIKYTPVLKFRTICHAQSF